jgi:hypothetical protein
MIFDWIPFGSRLPKRSARQIKEDEEFMDAIKKIKTLQVRDGRMSMDAEELREPLMESRRKHAHLIER